MKITKLLLTAVLAIGLPLTAFATILGVQQGGTGWGNLQSGYVLFGNGINPIGTSTNLYWDNVSFTGLFVTPNVWVGGNVMPTVANGNLGDSESIWLSGHINDIYNTGTLRDNGGGAGVSGQVPISTATGWNWGTLSAGGGSSKWATTTNGRAIRPNGGTNIGVVIGRLATTTNSLLEVNGTTTTNVLVSTSTTAESSFAGPLRIKSVNPLYFGDGTESFIYNSTGNSNLTLGTNAGDILIFSDIISVDGAVTMNGTWDVSTSNLSSSIPLQADNLYSIGSSGVRLNKIFSTYASTTAISATTVCLTGDLPCRTTWPTSGGSASKWATSTNGTAIYPSGGVNTSVVIGRTSTTTRSLLEVNGTTTTNILIATSTTATSTIYKALTVGTSTTAVFSPKTSTMMLLGNSCVYSTTSCGILQINWPGATGNPYAANSGLFFGVDDVTDQTAGQFYLQAQNNSQGNVSVGPLMLNPNGGGIIINGHSANTSATPSDLALVVGGNSSANNFIKLQNIANSSSFPYTGIISQVASTIAANEYQKAGIFFDVGADNFGCCYARQKIRFLADPSANNSSIQNNVVADTIFSMGYMNGYGTGNALTGVYAAVASSTGYGTLSVEMDTSNFALAVSNQGSTTCALCVLGVNGNGFVGIGTSSPTTALSVTGTTTIKGEIDLDSTGGSPIVGNATLSSGTVTVVTGAARPTSFIMLTRKTSGGTIGTAITYTTTSGAFTITSDNILDTSVFTWMVIN